MKKTFYKTWNKLYVFLEANILDYSYKVAEYWCFYLKSYTVQWKAYRCAIKLFEQYRVCGNINPNIVYSYKEHSISMLPERSRSLLLNFLLKKQNEGNLASTVSMYRSSCLRFFKFFDKKEINYCAMISSGVVK